MRKGFTLYEVAVVVVIIGLLMAISFKGRSFIFNARVKKDISKVVNLKTAVYSYVAGIGKHPSLSVTNLNCISCLDMNDFSSLQNKDIKVESMKTPAFFILYGCEFSKNGSIMPSISVDSTLAQNVCATVTKYDKFDRLEGGLTKALVCSIDKTLDDSNLEAGDGRYVISSWMGFNVDFTDCMQYANDTTINNGYALMITKTPNELLGK